MIGTKKQIRKAVYEANLLQWVENEMYKWYSDREQVSPTMDVAEKIISKVRENSQGLSIKEVEEMIENTTNNLKKEIFKNRPKGDWTEEDNKADEHNTTYWHGAVELALRVRELLKSYQKGLS